MKTSLVITIALFTIFTISEISCKTCMGFREKCLDDSDCCSENCYMAGRINDRFCMNPVNSTAAVKVEHGLCSYNASFHKESSDRMFKSLGINAAYAMLSVDSEIKLTNAANNKTIDVTINTYLQPKNETLLQLSKEAARELGVKDGETVPCSVYLYEKKTNHSAIKKFIGFSVSFIVIAFLIFNFM